MEIKTIRNTNLYWIIEENNLLLYEKYIKLSYSILINFFITPFIIFSLYLKYNNSDLQLSQEMITVLFVISMILLPVVIFSIIGVFCKLLIFTVTSNEIIINQNRLIIKSEKLNDLNIVDDSFLLYTKRVHTMEINYKCNSLILTTNDNEKYEILKVIKENTYNDLSKLKVDILKMLKNKKSSTLSDDSVEKV